MLTQPTFNPQKVLLKDLIYSKERKTTALSCTLCTTQYLPHKWNHALVSKQCENDNDEFTSRILWRTQEAEKVRLPISRPRAPGCKDRSFHTKLINNKAIITTIIDNHHDADILLFTSLDHLAERALRAGPTSWPHPSSNIQHPNQAYNIKHPN